MRTSPSAPSTFSPFPSLPHCWQTRRRLSIPNARSKSEPGAPLCKAGPRLPLGAAGEGVGTAGESLRGRGWPGAGADVGRGRRPPFFLPALGGGLRARWPTLVLYSSRPRCPDVDRLQEPAPSPPPHSLAKVCSLEFKRERLPYHAELSL